jgi:cysteinyl-tRNA synthetase
VLLDADRFAPRTPAAGSAEDHIEHYADGALAEVLDALMDDLNTPRAIAALHALAGLIRADIGLGKRAEVAALRSRILQAGAVLGLLQADPSDWFQEGVDEDSKAKVDQLIAARDAARRTKDWPEADRIRAELTALNVEVMDGPEGATWRFKETAAS